MLILNTFETVSYAVIYSAGAVGPIA